LVEGGVRGEEDRLRNQMCLNGRGLTGGENSRGWGFIRGNRRIGGNPVLRRKKALIVKRGAQRGFLLGGGGEQGYL